jgi:hypothetical protein
MACIFLLLFGWLMWRPHSLASVALHLLHLRIDGHQNITLDGLHFINISTLRKFFAIISEALGPPLLLPYGYFFTGFWTSK